MKTDGCEYCLEGKGLLNGDPASMGAMCKVYAEIDRHGDLVIELFENVDDHLHYPAGNEFIKFEFCPKCGRELDPDGKRNKAISREELMEMIK